MFRRDRLVSLPHCHRRRAGHGLRAVALALAALATPLAWPAAAHSDEPDGTWVYWSDYGVGAVSRVRPDGTEAGPVITGASVPIGIAVDAGSGKLYWVEAGTARIRRANLDGTSPEDVVATGPGIPYGIAVDVAGGKVYWTEYPGGDGIQRANLDGTGVETIHVTFGAGGLALDLPANHLYWTDYSSGRVGRVELDGAAPEILVAGRPNPNHVALDLDAGRILWTEGLYSGRVMAADLDGANAVALVNGEPSPTGLAFDTVERTIYWGNEDGHAVRRADDDGSGVATLVGGLARPVSVAVLVAVAGDVTPPVLTVPADIAVTATSAGGATVTFAATAVDAEDPAPTVSCSPPSGSIFALGTTEVTCTATDASGNSVESSFGVYVGVGWSGVRQPVNADGSSIFKQGSTVPVKFRLAGASAGIADLQAHLYVAKVSEGIAGTEAEAASTSAADSGNTFRYDATADQYVFNWGTKPLSAGTYRLRIDLGDGASHTVLVSLKL
jgi:sugar lactone lactonase YvrE